MEKGLMDSPLRIYTDGGCSGNPGPGGWAFVIVLDTFQGGNVIASDMGGEKETTNNRMELLAVISSLRALKSLRDVPRKPVLYTDSRYVQLGITDWINKWKRNSWKTSGRKPVKNKDLWTELENLAGELEISWKWVKGHSGDEYNERCDRMSREAINSIRLSFK
ncbi:MAG: ribonuclease HI [Treponema sp.]|jgi:ribonuclease HI|nr:ribonuclease HI [Treponema sp.]